jgi:polyvinyl alcohol dehydrogenase (cytochrome)
MGLSEASPRIGNWREIATAIMLAVLAAGSLSAQNVSWPMFGQNPANNASTSGATISASNASTLKPKWIFTTGGDVSARAAVVNGIVYFPDWGGNLWALNATTGKELWSRKLPEYGLPSGTVSRTSPAVVGGKVYIGTQKGGWLLAINAETGDLVWKSQPVPASNYPQITAAPTVVGDVVYVGLTTEEESLAENTAYPCCTTRGGVVAVNANNGTRLWLAYTVPEGYSGAGVWGSSPVVDLARNTVFVATGNNYADPTDKTYLACVDAGHSDAACQSPEDHADSILALDAKTGAVKWGTRLMQWPETTGTDDFNVSCKHSPDKNCPKPVGPDYDFGSGPNEISYKTSNSSGTIIGAGQKSGIYHALDPDTGVELWHTEVGPGSAGGGIMWGSASDGERIYVAISNSSHAHYAAGSAGSWAALDPATGKILWQKPDPNGAPDMGPLAVANGIVYAPSMAGSATAPNMFVLNASNGEKLWSFPAGSSVNAGATISGAMVYWGSGYARLKGNGVTGGKNKFYAFSGNGK